MGNGKGSKLGPDKPVAPIVEALEASVIFDLAKDGLGFNRLLASMFEPRLAHKSFPGLRFQLVVPVIDLDSPLARLSLITQAPQRARTRTGSFSAIKSPRHGGKSRLSF